MQNRNIASTFAKGLAVLGAFDGGAPVLSLAEIARRSSLDRAAARRLVLTLVDQGFVETDDARGYRLTPRVLRFAGGYLSGRQVGRLVQPVLDRHAAQAGAPISMAVLDGQDVLLLAQSTLQNSVVTFGFTLGSTLPLLHTSLGRMLLALRPADVAARLLATAPMQARTPEALTDRRLISAEVDQARSAGLCIARAQLEAGITGYAVPTGPETVIGLSRAHGLGRDAQADQAAIKALQLCAAELIQTGAV